MDLRWYKQVHSLTQKLLLTPNQTRADCQECRFAVMRPCMPPSHSPWYSLYGFRNTPGSETTAFPLSASLNQSSAIITVTPRLKTVYSRKHAKSRRLRGHWTPLFRTQTLDVHVSPQKKSFLLFQSASNHGEPLVLARTQELDRLKWPRRHCICGIFTLGTQSCPACCCLSRNQHKFLFETIATCKIAWYNFLFLHFIHVSLSPQKSGVKMKFYFF